MAWEELHTGPWDQVPVAWREAYTLATISSALQSLQASVCHQDTICDWNKHASACLRNLDVAVLVGGPRMADVVHPFINSLQTSITPPSGASHHAILLSNDAQTPCTSLQNCTRESPNLVAPPLCSSTCSLSLPTSKRLQTLEAIAAPDMLGFEHQYMNRAQPCVMNGVAEAWPAMERCAFCLCVLCTPGVLHEKCCTVPMRAQACICPNTPSLGHLAFECVRHGHKYFHCGIAVCRWQSSEYLLQLLGHRTVPVEVGSSYLAQGWGQKMITFREFFHTAFGCGLQGSQSISCAPHEAVASENEQTADSSVGGAQSYKQCPIDTSSGCPEPHRKRQRSTHCDTVKAVSTSAQRDCSQAEVCANATQTDVPAGTDNAKLLYLAQHSLFDQVRGLRKDIMVCSSLHLEPLEASQTAVRLLY